MVWVIIIAYIIVGLIVSGVVYAIDEHITGYGDDYSFYVISFVSWPLFVIFGIIFGFGWLIARVTSPLIGKIIQSIFKGEDKNV